jgi:hypothetical protein
MERGNLCRFGLARGGDIIVEDVRGQPLDQLLNAVKRSAACVSIASARMATGRSSLPITLGSR